MINVKSLNVHTSLLRTHPSDISNLKKEMKKELMNVNTAHQQLNKIAS